MNEDTIRELLTRLNKGEISVDEGLERLKHLPYEDIGVAHIDHHRSLRKGFPEVIYGESKSAEQIAGILERMVGQETVILVTRISPGKAESVMKTIPGCRYDAEARMITWGRPEAQLEVRGSILVISAGTSDIPVAREAMLTAEAMGNPVSSLFDVGVAGLHRLLSHWDIIRQAAVIVVAAGMEGALASVVGGLVDVPVIAVPTSVGYGASFGGVTALLAMLNSCAAGVTVVNIDNGFGAGYAAGLILSSRKESGKEERNP